MLKKALRIGLLGIGLGLFLTLFLLTLNRYPHIWNRFLEVFDLKNLKTWFDNYVESKVNVYSEFTESVETKVETVVTAVDSFNLSWDTILSFLFQFMNILYNILMYTLNVGINVIVLMAIFIKESIYGTNLTIKTSKAATLAIKLRKGIVWCCLKANQSRLFLWKEIKKYRRFIALSMLLVGLTSTFLVSFLVEFIIFVVAYIYHAINLETYVVLESLFKTIVLVLYPILIKIPRFVWYLLIYGSFFLIAVKRANFKLEKNHRKLKEFTRDKLTQTTFINGAPGTGKTLMNVSLSLASEENYIDDLQDKLLSYEAKHRYLNFATIRANPDAYPEHKEYTDTLKNLNERGTYLISNYSIYSPYFKEYSKIFNFDYMRKNIPAAKYPLEEYIVMSLSEIDKEYNSHDNMKEVGSDGAHTFFSTVSHDLKRHCKIFCDYQLKDQVPLRIRGNAEYFLNIKKRELKYPILLAAYYLPFKLIHSLVKKLIRSYELRTRTINKDTKRTSISPYKRNNVNLIYVILRQLHSTLTIIERWFEHYAYFKMTASLSQEGDAKGIPVKVCINLCDLSIENQKLYDSTFLSYAYEQKKNMDFKDIDEFTKLTPSIEELNKCNSRFYNKLNGLE